MDVAQVKRRKLDDASRTTTLCDLPDCVLQQILWFLPMKVALRMRTVSKRWQSLWRSAPKLKFQDKYYSTERQKMLFVAFVEKTLRRRDKSCVNALCLSSLVEYGASRLDALIGFALEHNVQELLLRVDIKLLPSRIFRAEKLTKLHLKELKYALIIPRRVHLPNLKDLTLQSVWLRDDDSTEELLSCPSLETLSILECSCEDQKNPITVSAPMLNAITIHDCPSDFLDLEINAPSLKHIEHKYAPRNRLVVSDSPLLEEAFVYTTEASWTKKRKTENLMKLLEDISCVKNLTLSFELLEHFNPDVDIIPVFSNLRNLKIIFYSDWEEVYFTKTQLMFSFIRSCPDIETLEFEGLHTNGENNQCPSVPFFLPNLKKVTVIRFDRLSKDLSHLLFLLKHAPVLEEAVFKYYERSLTELTELDKHFFDKIPKAAKSDKVRVVVS